MTRQSIISLIILAAAVAAALIILYFLGKRNQKKRDEQQAMIDQMKQQYSMLIIDKKRVRMKHSGLPEQVIKEAPRMAKIAKMNIVKAKVGPKIMSFITDKDVYDVIPVKKEVKATVSGLYITDVRGVRGPLEKPVKKKNFFQKLMGEK